MEKNRPRIGRKLHRLDLLIKLYLRTFGDELIPPSQMRMLEFIEKNDGCTQTEVAEEMQVSPASVAQSIKRMEASGCVIKKVCAGNLRANNLQITEKGSLAARNCRVVFDGLEARMFDGFSDDERLLTDELISRLIKNLEPDEVESLDNAELKRLVSVDKPGADKAGEADPSASEPASEAASEIKPRPKPII